MPPLAAFPRAHQLTFNYYAGLIAFLDDDYATAEPLLHAAYTMCPASTSSPAAARNRDRILTYLIPTRLLTAHRLPTRALLAPSPPLDRLFTPLCTALRRADLAAFTRALDAAEPALVHARIYLTLERARDILLRNLFRRVFLAGGFEPPTAAAAAAKDGEAAGDAPTAPVRRTRIPVREFAAALVLSGADVGDGEGGWDRDEVECLIANAIYKGFMKGYIARERGMVVLSKAGAFPGTGV